MDVMKGTAKQTLEFIVKQISVFEASPDGIWLLLVLHD